VPDNNADIQTNTSPVTLARAVDENDIAYWFYRARRAGWEIRQEPGLLLFVSGLRHDYWQNAVLRTSLLPASASFAFSAPLLLQQRWIGATPSSAEAGLAMR
jgi:hypothetical protein